jgi:hypothetical protein
MPTSHSKAKPASQRTSPSGRTRVKVGALMGLLILGAIAWYLSASKQVPLSRTGYELANALYAACNLEDPARLTAVASKLESESLSPEERSSVASIVSLAQTGNWQDAASKARYLLESQDRP